MLLDGGDEAQGADAQRDTIRLITMFAQDAPLTWIIASHPEPHIATAFNEMATSNRSEFMRINLTEIKFNHSKKEKCMIKGNNWCVRPPVN
jgi:hypothetical protein